MLWTQKPAQAVTFGIPVCVGLGVGNQALTNQLQQCPAGGLSPLWSHPCGPARNLMAPQLENVSWNFIQKRYQKNFFSSLGLLGTSYSQNIGSIL